MTSEQIALSSAGIALAALAVAFASLWRTHYAKAAPVVLCGVLRHRIYPIRSEGECWYISSFDVATSILNSGAQPVLITGMRLMLRFQKVPMPNNYEVVPANWDITEAGARSITKDRFAWIDKVAPRDFMPFAVLPKQTVIKHFVFETRWDHPVIQDAIDCRIEAESAGEWREGERWNLALGARVWSELANVGTSMSYVAEGRVKSGAMVFPKDLHKYTGTQDPIPKDGFMAPPSYLNYPGD